MLSWAGADKKAKIDDEVFGSLIMRLNVARLYALEILAVYTEGHICALGIIII
jgi:hypothetical protein